MRAFVYNISDNSVTLCQLNTVELNSQGSIKLREHMATWSVPVFVQTPCELSNHCVRIKAVVRVAE